MHKKYYYRVYYSDYLYSDELLNIECDIVDYYNPNYLICECYDDKEEPIIIKTIPLARVYFIQREKRVIGDE